MYVGTVIMKTRACRYCAQALLVYIITEVRTRLSNSSMHSSSDCTTYTCTYVFSTLQWAIFTRSYVHGQPWRESKGSYDGCKVYNNFQKVCPVSSMDLD